MHISMIKFSFTRFARQNLIPFIATITLLRPLLFPMHMQVPYTSRVQHLMPHAQL
jgi:hypothetical protein